MAALEAKSLDSPDEVRPFVSNGRAEIVNLSSGMGSLAEMSAGYIAYRLSKAGINVLTRVIAAETEGMGILVNSVDPGWVQTGMGGRGASRTVYKGAETVVWLATVPDSGPTGGFFLDRKPIPW